MPPYVKEIADLEQRLKTALLKGTGNHEAGDLVDRVMEHALDAAEKANRCDILGTLRSLGLHEFGSAQVSDVIDDHIHDLDSWGAAHRYRVEVSEQLYREIAKAFETWCDCRS